MVLDVWTDKQQDSFLNGKNMQTFEKKFGKDES